MNWTAGKPTRAGWYWMRAPKCGWRDCVVCVDKDEDGFYIDVGDCDSEYVMDIEAEWLGPITPDSYQHGLASELRQSVSTGQQGRVGKVAQTKVVKAMLKRMGW